MGERVGSPAGRPDLFQSFFEDSEGVEALVHWPIVTLPALLWPVWALALAMATVNYGLRRRIAC